jgi:hypothetical protein
LKTVEIPPIYTADTDRITVDLRLDRRTHEGRVPCTYIVRLNDVEVLRGDDVASGVGANPTEEEMVRSLAAFLSAAGESLDRSGLMSPYIDDYTLDQMLFLAHHHERFSAFGAFFGQENLPPEDMD